MKATLLLDESGQEAIDRPVVVGVAACLDYDALERRLRKLHREWSSEERWVGQESFEVFREDGFHNNQIPIELQLRFLDILEETSGFRISASFSNRQTLLRLDDQRRCIVLYARLLRDVFLRHGIDEYHLVIETNTFLNPKWDELIASALKFAAARARPSWRPPKVTFEVATKQQSLSLGIVDFALKAVGDWVKDGMPRDASRSSFRNYRVLERRFAVIEDADTGERITRRTRQPV